MGAILHIMLFLLRLRFPEPNITNFADASRIHIQRYKCPKCRAPFCCVQCSKDHKANHCQTTIDLANNSRTVPSTRSNNNVTCEMESQYTSSIVLNTNKTVRKRNHDEVDSEDDEPGFNITPEMRQQLRQSTWLRNELKDGGLRYLIGTIDAASDVEDDDNNTKMSFNKTRGKKTFEGITPRVLALARSKQTHPKFASFIDQMLLTAGVLQPVDGAGVDDHLSLVPIPRRCDVGTARCDDSKDSASEEDSSDGDDSSDSESSSQSERGYSEEEGEAT